MVTYYHYTTPPNAKAIIQCGVIRKSTKSARGRRDDARYGSGVYMTRVPPSAAKHEIAFNNYDGLTQSVVERLIASGKSLTDNFLSRERGDDMYMIYRVGQKVRPHTHGHDSVKS